MHFAAEKEKKLQTNNQLTAATLHSLKGRTDVSGEDCDERTVKVSDAAQRSEKVVSTRHLQKSFHSIEISASNCNNACF